LAGFLGEPLDRGIETVELAYLTVAVSDIPDEGATKASAEELDRDHNLGILLQCV
jgi:hypothetical protein